MIDIFRAEENACLLGTDAVRDGVDVPGNALRLIVFDRVPWPRPDILYRARRSAFGGGSYTDMLTRLKLKQAFGRLVRRANDRGVFVLLDPMMPTRLLGAFPQGVEVRRCGLAEAVAETHAFFGTAPVPTPSVDVDECRLVERTFRASRRRFGVVDRADEFASAALAFAGVTVKRMEEQGVSERVDAVVIGAGVVGLAVARALAMAGREVIVLEQHDLIGSETSSRHSEVIHAGIYYPPGSVKARVCVCGKKLLYDYVESHGVPYKKLGKLIVATSEDQIASLQQIKERAEQNGVHDLEFLSHNEVAAREPDLRCLSALWSPSTGVIDSHAFMLALQGDLEAHGGMIAFLSPVEGGKVMADGIVLRVGGLHGMTLTAKMIVVAATA